MHHKDKRLVLSWLKDLKAKGYIKWIYDASDFANKTKPAVYYIALNGVRYLRSAGDYPPEELRKRYKESTRQPSFIEKCLLLAECCTNIESRIVGGTHYSYATAADYGDTANQYHALSELQPSMCFTKSVTTPESVNTTNYLLEIFDVTTPRYMVKKRLIEYVNFLEEGDWEQNSRDIIAPIVLIACVSTAELIYAKRRAQRLLAGALNTSEIHIRFATFEKIRGLGVTGAIWEEA